MKASITEHYILVETDDIDFTVLRAAIQESRQINYLEELLETLIEEL